jgi:hypothetical protein
MAALADIRVALAARLALLSDVQTSAYMLANPTPPAMHVVPGETQYDAAFARGLDRWTLMIQGFVSLTSDIAAQKKLDAWLAAEGTNSVKDIVEGDKTLGGVVADTRVTRHGGYQQLVRASGNDLLMAEWTVEVLATSS